MLRRVWVCVDSGTREGVGKGIVVVKLRLWRSGECGVGVANGRSRMRAKSRVNITMGVSGQWRRPLECELSLLIRVPGRQDVVRGNKSNATSDVNWIRMFADVNRAAWFAPKSTWESGYATVTDKRLRKIHNIRIVGGGQSV